MMELEELPEGWAWTTVAELGKVVSGGTPSTKEASYWGGDVAWISPSDLTGYTDKFIARGAKSITAAGLQNSSATAMPAGSIHFSSRAPIGYTVISSQNMTTNQGFKSLVPADGVFNEYIYYYFKSAKQLAESVATGTTFKEISGAAFSKLPVPLPPSAEQHRIVAKIEELFSELDQGVASLKTAREQLKVYRQSLLKNAFEGKLTAAWRTAHTDQIETAAVAWQEKPLGQLLGFLTSGSRGWASYYASSGDLFVRAQNIKHDCLELDDVAFVSLPDKAEGLRTRIQQGDLLITITGANVTKAALVKHGLGTAYVSQHVALCRPTGEILQDYLYWFVVAEAAGRKQLTEMAYGAGKPGLNLENIRSVQVPLPSLSEQKEIVELIESKLSEADQLDQTLAIALQQAEVLRQSILKKAFCGQLVEQDQNDEPASALLERIRAEKVGRVGRKTRRVAVERPEALELTHAPGQVIPFPLPLPGIAAKDLHAGILAMAYRLHEQHPERLQHFGHVKAEKISHLVEAHLGLDLERQPFKDAAGPNDHPHLKRVEHRARMANWFDVTRLESGKYVFHPKSGFDRLLTKTRQVLGGRLAEVERLLDLMLPMTMRQAEILATVYAAWNNLLLLGKAPSDEEIVSEARENWHESKLKIERDKFFTALNWMRSKGLIPSGQGRFVAAKGE